MFMPERPLSFPAGKALKIKELRSIFCKELSESTGGGEAMRKERNRWMGLKMWLYSPRLAIWGEGVVEGLIFSLIALAMWRVAWE